jgi:hypothetical protein
MEMATARILSVLLALFASAVIAAPPASFDAAWTYVSAKGRSERWVVVSSTRSRNEYFQCENLDDVVRCVIPVWVKRVPEHGRYLPFEGREAPYPDVEGSQLKEFLNQVGLAKAEAVLKAQGLVPFFVYSQIKNEQMKTVGTQCDLRVIVPVTYKRFEALAKIYLKEVFGASEADGYEFEADG